VVILDNLESADYVLENLLSKERFLELERRRGDYKKMKTTTKQVALNYSAGDFLIRVKNASMAKNKTFSVQSNKQIVAIAEALKKTHFLDSVKNEKGILTVSLAFKDKKPLIMDIKLISKPGLRIYLGVTEIEKKRGPSIYLVSTPKGVVSSLEAVKNRIGGEVIAEIW